MDVPLFYQDENQQRGNTPLLDIPPPPVTAPTPSTSHFGCPLHQPLRYGTEANIHQEAERHPPPTPPPPQIPLHPPTSPVELETFRTQEAEFRHFRIYHQHPTLELSNTPPPGYNDFAGSGVIPEAHQEDLASDACCIHRRAIQLDGPICGHNCCSHHPVVLFRNWSKVHS